MSSLWAMVMEEFRRILSTRPAFAAMVLAIVVYAFLYPQPYLEESLRDVPIAVIDQDQSTTSRALIRRIDATDSVAVGARLADMAEARNAFFYRRVYGVLVIPARFESTLLRGEPAAVALYGDASYFMLYQEVSAGVLAPARSTGAAVEFWRLVNGGADPTLAAAAVDPLPLTSVALFNPQGGYASNVIPATLVLILQQTLLMGIGLLNTSRTAPRPRWLDALSRVATRTTAYTGLYLVHLLFYSLVVPGLFGIPRLGALGDTLLFALPFLLSASLLGLTISALFRTPHGVQLVLGALGMPLFFLSGFSWPQEAMPAALSPLAQLIPSTAAIDGLVRIGQMGATLADVREQWANLWMLTILYGLAALLAEGRGGRQSEPPPLPGSG